MFSKTSSKPPSSYNSLPPQIDQKQVNAQNTEHEYPRAPALYSRQRQQELIKKIQALRDIEESKSVLPIEKSLVATEVLFSLINEGEINDLESQLSQLSQLKLANLQKGLDELDVFDTMHLARKPGWIPEERHRLWKELLETAIALFPDAQLLKLQKKLVNLQKGLDELDGIEAVSKYKPTWIAGNRHDLQTQLIEERQKARSYIAAAQRALEKQAHFQELPIHHPQPKKPGIPY